jgi:hypothetical protein
MFITCVTTGAKSPDLKPYGNNADEQASGLNRSTSWQFSGLNPNTTYQFRAEVWTAGGVEYWSLADSNERFTTEALAPPSAVNVSISGLGGNSFYVDLSGGSGSSTMNIEVRTGSQSGTVVWSRYGQALSPQFTVSGLYEYTNYYIKAYGNNAGGNGTPGYATTKTLDKTLPSVSITSSDGVGRIFFDFSGYDNTPTGGVASGLANYIVWISPRNSTSLGAVRHATISNLSLSYFTFETDYDGLNFVGGSTYTIGVRAEDASGNWSALSLVTLTYTKARPDNWNWTTTKTAGTNVNVTAVEWESLGKSINQFRTYKSYVVRDFTVPVAGNIITAVIFNQYCNALRDMSPPTSPPSNKVGKDPANNIEGDLLYASHFTLLATSLNSIT